MVYSLQRAVVGDYEEWKAVVEEFIARAETMRGVDPDVHEDLRERAVDTIEPAVQSAYGDADDVTEHVIERDVEATVDAVRSDIIGDGA